MAIWNDERNLAIFKGFDLTRSNLPKDLSTAFV
jgi:hypothetical protein